MTDPTTLLVAIIGILAVCLAWGIWHETRGARERRAKLRSEPHGSTPPAPDPMSPASPKEDQ